MIIEDICVWDNVLNLRGKILTASEAGERRRQKYQKINIRRQKKEKNSKIQSDMR